MPLEVYAVATAPVSDAAYEELGGFDGYAVVDALPMAPYFRPLADGGLVAGGGTVTLPAGLGAPGCARPASGPGRGWAAGCGPCTPSWPICRSPTAGPAASA